MVQTHHQRPALHAYPGGLDTPVPAYMPTTMVHRCTWYWSRMDNASDDNAIKKTLKAQMHIVYESYESISSKFRLHGLPTSSAYCCCLDHSISINKFSKDDQVAYLVISREHTWQRDREIVAWCGHRTPHGIHIHDIRDSGLVARGDGGQGVPDLHDVGEVHDG